jgi:hypothetical protein
MASMVLHVALGARSEDGGPTPARDVSTVGGAR